MLRIAGSDGDRRSNYICRVRSNVPEVEFLKLTSRMALNY